jgi:hypothetical protein
MADRCLPFQIISVKTLKIYLLQQIKIKISSPPPTLSGFEFPEGNLCTYSIKNPGESVLREVFFLY